MATYTNTSLGDRYAEFTVIALTLIALLFGWAYKSSIENRGVLFESGSISAQAPSGWLQATTEGDEILRTTDLASSGFGSTYVLRKIPTAREATAAQTASLLALEHGQELTAFRVLEQHEVVVLDRPAYELSYVFVESNPDVTHSEIPSIVRGVDYIFINGDHAIVATYWADEENYELDLGRFHKFLASIDY